MICANTSWNLINFRSGLILSLIDNGYDVVAVAPSDEHSSKLLDMGCRYIAIPMEKRGKSPFVDALLFLRFLLTILKYQPEFFLSYTIKPNIYGSIAANLLKVTTINNIAGLGTMFEKSGILSYLVKFLYRISLRHSNCVFFQNEDDLALFKNAGLVSESQASLLPGSGVDLTFFQPTFDTKMYHEYDLIGALNGKSDYSRICIEFIMVARLLWSKGVAEYVEAARRIGIIYPKVKFNLLGFLEDKNPNAVDELTLKSWISEGFINYLGSTDDVRPYVLNSDCVVLPSYYMEGTPKSLLEAAAMAKPIITTDWVGCRNVVDEGVNGFLCKPKDVDDLEMKMREMIELGFDKRYEMGKNSRAKAEQKFDENLVISAYIEKLNELA